MEVQPDDLAQLQAALAPWRTKLARHPLYNRLQSLEDVRVFMQQHLFAVWDFMSLLKWLQLHLTCTQVPWFPSIDPVSRRLINEIVLAEESDDDGQGGYASHLELYLAAMRQCGADLKPWERFIATMHDGASLSEALCTAEVPPGAAEFVQATFRLLASGKPHAIAAAFAIGREDLIPDMFRELIVDIDRQLPGRLTKFRDYLQRHVELDEEHHTPMALRMLCQLCGADAQRWAEAEAAVVQSYSARLALWDAILASIESPSKV